MTKDKDEKAVIRARMERTGESYAAARAQLARSGAAGDPESGDDRPAREQRSVVTTPAAGEAIEASQGLMSSAWHLVLALGRTRGIAARVLADQGLPYRLEAPPAEPGSPAAQTLSTGMDVAFGLAARERAGRLDTGILLRGALAVLRPEYLPEAQRPLLATLQKADVEGLCTAAWSEYGPEGDDQPASSGGGVFTRFSDRARKVVVGAQEEARDLGHGYIGTEHLLLGVLREGDGVAARALPGLELGRVREAVVALVGQSEGEVGGHLPFTPRARDVLLLAAVKADELAHDYIGTHHLLLALVDEGKGIAAQVLLDAGLTAVVVRERILTVLATLPSDAAPG